MTEPEELPEGPYQVNTSPYFENGKPSIIWGPDGPGHGAICELSPTAPREYNIKLARLLAGSWEMREIINAFLTTDLYADSEGLVNYDFPNTEDGDLLKIRAEAIIEKIDGK